jgi:hypothetical protein
MQQAIVWHSRLSQAEASHRFLIGVWGCAQHIGRTVAGAGHGGTMRNVPQRPEPQMRSQPH